MQTEKTPYEILKENYEFAKDNFNTANWLKNIYEQKVKAQEREIELYKQGTPSFIEHTYIDFEKAKVYEKPNFFELQMLN
jgi:hypothetical protein